MSNLVAIAYRDEHQAATMLDAAKQLNDDGAIDLEAAVAIRKDPAGHVSVQHAFRSSTGKGAVGGLVLGTALGLLLLAPVAGAIFGLASGTLAGTLADVGRIDDFAAEVSDNLKPGSSAILILVRAAEDPEQALAALHQHGGTIIRTTLPDDVDARIPAALG